ncbi:MAG: TetR/AcrR family transcriptional regulator [Pseudomonadota bacterium]
MRSRNDEEKALRRESLLNAAQKVFFDQGFEQTAMEDISSAAGFSRGLLYVYFDDKKDIYDAVKVRASQALKKRMSEYSGQQTRGIDKVYACGLAYYHFFRDDRDYFDCLAHHLSLDNQHPEANSSKPEVAESELAVMQVMLDAFDTGLKDGTVNSAAVKNPMESAMFCRGSLHGLILLQSSKVLEKVSLSSEAFVMNALDRIIDVYRVH